MFTPPIFTDMHQEEVKFERPVSEETIKKLIANINWMRELYTIGEIVYIHTDADNVDQPDYSYWQPCDGTEITNPNSPLKTDPLVPEVKRYTPDLRNTYLRFTIDEHTNEIINVEGPVQASKVIGDLKYTAKDSGVGGNSIGIQYTGGGTWGNEVVSVSGNIINITIEEGVTTVDSIKYAIDNHQDAKNLVTVFIVGSASAKEYAMGLTYLQGGSIEAGAVGSQRHNLAHSHGGNTGIAGGGWGLDTDPERVSGGGHRHSISSMFDNNYLIDAPKYIYFVPFMRIV